MRTCAEEKHQYNGKCRGQNGALTYFKEDNEMALSNLFGWGKKDEENKAPAAACGAADKPAETPAACGAADKPAETPAACGAADKPAEAPAACGAAEKPTEKPAACGSACGVGNKK